MDENDKTRRNLVVFSAAVILLCFFDVSITHVAEDQLKLHAHIPAWKMWMAALFVLGYLLARFSLSEEGRKTGSALEGVQVEFHRTKVVAYARRKVQSILDDLERSPDPIAQEIRTTRDRFLAKGNPKQYISTVVENAVSTPPFHFASVGVRFAVTRGIANTEAMLVRVEVPRALRRDFLLISFFVGYVWSPEAISRVPPYLFASIAAMLAASKLTLAFFERLWS